MPIGGTFMLKNRLISILDVTGFAVLEPVVRLCAGEEPREQVGKIVRFIGVPILAFMAFLGAWWLVAMNVKTKYGTLPTPSEVWVQAKELTAGHFESQKKKQAFYVQQKNLSAQMKSQAGKLRTQEQAAQVPADKQRLAEGATRMEENAAKALKRRYSGPPTYLDQIATSLKTVFAGFVVASLIAVPLGICGGLSKTFMAAISPMIAIFKPVSPLAWLPIVMILVGALYTTEPDKAWFEKSFISSALTVALCSLWPTLVNTSLAVASIDKDYMNVARVLKLSWSTQLFRIIIPASLPLMFTGLRISLGVGWMVLIAAEMLAQNPGLGKFVWDMFQNGSQQTLAQIMVAVFTIGIIGFILDRIMVVLQKSVSYDSTAM